MGAKRRRRRIVQLCMTAAGDTHWIWALCDDGTVWSRANDYPGTPPYWKRIDTNVVDYGDVPSPDKAARFAHPQDDVP